MSPRSYLDAKNPVPLNLGKFLAVQNNCRRGYTTNAVDVQHGGCGLGRSCRNSRKCNSRKSHHDSEEDLCKHFNLVLRLMRYAQPYVRLLNFWGRFSRNPCETLIVNSNSYYSEIHAVNRERNDIQIAVSAVKAGPSSSAARRSNPTGSFRSNIGRVR